MATGTELMGTERERLRLGMDRVIEPAGALPQPATRLDASGPVRAHEFEVAVERLCLDATSFRDIRSRAGAEPQRMAELIAGIVAERGKMHNPHTDSGGIALGTVTAVGAAVSNPPAVGDRIATLASLTLTPLRLQRVLAVDPDSAQVEVDGTAYVTPSAPWGLIRDDLSLSTAVEVYDVYGAASHTRRLTRAGDTVLVLGCGHAGKLAMAAARAAGAGTVIGVDVDPDAVALVREHGLCDLGVATDLRDPLRALAELEAAGAARADLTIVVVSARGCEPASILLTATGGTVLFFSMATSFQTAALTADGIAHDVTMLIGSGFAPDAGAYALDLVRADPGLRAALEGAVR